MNGSMTEQDAVAAHWVTALADLFAAVPRPIALHEPEIGAAEQRLVGECLASGWVSSVGEFVTRFGDELAKVCGARHAIPCVNGTTALHMCCLLAGVEPGDEVLVPALTFVGTANAVSHAGAIPHFVDCEARRLGVDADKLDDYLARSARLEAGGARNLASGRLIKALVVVHIFGHPVALDELAAVARKWNLVLIEDAAESLGSTYKGLPVGALARLGALSFNGNKIVTSGAGGAILTNDAELGARARHLTTTAKQAHRFEFIHDEIGYNYRLPNLNAALGLAQLAKLDDFIVRKRAVAATYLEALAELPGAHVLREPADSISNYWLNALVLDNEHRALRDTLLEATNDLGIMTRPLWRPMHLLPIYAGHPRMPDLSTAENLYARVINLPSSPCLAPLLVVARRRAP